MPQETPPDTTVISSPEMLQRITFAAANPRRLMLLGLVALLSLLATGAPKAAGPTPQHSGYPNYELRGSRGDPALADIAMVHGTYYDGRLDRQLIIHDYLEPAHAEYDIAFYDAGQSLDPAAFGDFKLVIILNLRGAGQQRWTDEQIRQAVAYVRGGGRIVMLGAVPMQLGGDSRNLKRLEPLIGAEHSPRVSGAGRILRPEHPLLADLVARTAAHQAGEADAGVDWIRSGGNHAYSRLTTARALVGTDNQAWVAVNPVGQGEVFLLGSTMFRLREYSNADVSSYGSIIARIIDSVDPRRVLTDREPWRLEPLGPVVDLHAPALSPPIRQPLESNFQRRSLPGAPVELVRDGTPQAVLITADRPSAAARAAAERIQSALERMTGAVLPIRTESSVRVRRDGESLRVRVDRKDMPFVVLVGDSKLAGELGFAPDTLPYEGYVIRTTGNVLLVAGRDLPDGGRPTFGTRHGAYALLEGHVGFRWLWPGELGEVVPEGRSVAIQPVHEEDAPALRLRNLRNSGSGGVVQRGGREVHRSSAYQLGLDRLGFDVHAFREWHGESGAWFEAQRTGSSIRLGYGHSYGGWWDTYGKDHPEWFALQPDGRRTQHPSRERLSVCNEELRAEVARTRIRELSANPDLQAASISPNDGGSQNTFDADPACRVYEAANAPRDHSITERVGGLVRHNPYPSLSDRYASFYSAVAARVAEVHPDRWVAGYAYSNYRRPPLHTDLHPNVLIGFVGLSYNNETTRQRDRESWDGWAARAQQMFLRPNALLHGRHGLPAVFVAKLDEDIKHTYQTGMIGADFDSILHFWATQGINHYVLARLLWDPSRDADAIVRDWLEAGFGPAAPHVGRYFREVEDLTDLMAQGAVATAAADDEEALGDDEQEETESGESLQGHLFSPERVAALRRHLEQAREAAAGNATILERIDFIEVGLDHAAHTHRISRAVAEGDPRGAEYMAERYQFFRQVFERHPFAINVAYIASRDTTLARQLGFAFEGD